MLFTRSLRQVLRGARNQSAVLRKAADTRGGGLPALGEDLTDLGGKAINVCCTVKQEGQEAGRVGASRSKGKLGGPAGDKGDITCHEKTILHDVT